MAFMGAKNIKGIEEWETKSLENMDKIFKDCKDFNANLSNWRTERLKSININCIYFKIDFCLQILK